MFFDELPALLRQVRIARGLSQASVGKAAGMPQSHVARLEGGDDIRLSTASRVAAVLGLNVRIEPDLQALFEYPPAGSAFAAARDFGVDMSDLFERFQMSPSERLERATANSRGMSELFS